MPSMSRNGLKSVTYFSFHRRSIPGLTLEIPAFPGMITQELQIPYTMVCSSRLGRGQEEEARWHSLT